MANSAQESTAQAAYRFRWLDYLRSFSIILVVFSHTRSGLIHNGLFENAEAFVLHSQALTSCAMPLFFFMSGMFISSGVRKPFGHFVSDKLRSIAYPYFLWSTIHIVVGAVLAEQTYNKMYIGELWTIVYLPIVHYWFFYALFCIMMLYGAASKLGVRPEYFFACTIALYLGGFVGLDLQNWIVPDSLQRNLPYFALGAVINRGGPVVRLSEARSHVLIPLIAAGLLTSWYAVTLGWREDLLLRFVTIVPGAIGLMSLAILLERHNLLRLLPYLGRFSMQIYVAHVFGLTAMRIFLLNFLGIENLWVHFILGMGAGVAFSIALAFCARVAKFRYLYVLPGPNMGITR